MKTLTTPVTTEAAAPQGAWCEVFDFYLKSAITTPWGTVSTLRLTPLPGGFAFFTPTIAPEPAGTQGDAQAYQHWPLKRELVRGSSKFADGSMVITASNVTAEWAQMLNDVDWYDTPVIIRKVPVQSGLTEDDCAVLWTGFVDAATITNELIQFACSNDLSGLSTVLPSENMHQNCRFRWGDDYCTAIRYRSTNYKSGTCGAGGTTTRIKSTDFSEDDAAAGYVAESVTGSGAANTITRAGHGLGDGDRVRFGGTAVPGGLTAGKWYWVRDAAANTFKIAAELFGDAIDLTSDGTAVTMDSSGPYGTDLVDALADGAITASDEKAGATASEVNQGDGAEIRLTSSDRWYVDDQVVFTGAGLPAPLVAATTYNVVKANNNLTPLVRIEVSATYRGNPIEITSPGGGTAAAQDAHAHRVQYQDGGSYGWKLTDSDDWGTRWQGFWSIPDAQSGVANPLLKPYITFDFGGAVTPKVWRLACPRLVPREELVRMVSIHSSAAADFATSTHETHFEIPPLAGDFYDVLIPGAASARYWRICIRSRWAEEFMPSMLHKVRAYANARNWWSSGTIAFKADTTTAALRGVSRRVLSSWDGEVRVSALPVSPANGDTFTIARGCPRTWNGCCERRNWENFGGFLDLANQSVIR